MQYSKTRFVVEIDLVRFRATEALKTLENALDVAQRHIADGDLDGHCYARASGALEAGASIAIEDLRRIVGQFNTKTWSEYPAEMQRKVNDLEAMQRLAERSPDGKVKP